ncbi:hypothetical protein CAPTEDRAFT_196017 [Capitella teleta]|uniref:Uncharacterized protein n=1 Tax=Capitella teleta TaxID=283909 RepID=R7VAN8_CAPTE|nr:hypothetical protein CAPTEDRAFT_196017 [Capitella teleta]|eukprot:ELU15908.1 hypothetical protein CAPTEDRAFT_196017 [Capitella teleta]
MHNIDYIPLLMDTIGGVNVEVICMAAKPLWVSDKKIVAGLYAFAYREGSLIHECCVHDCAACPDRTVVLHNGFTYCCSDCESGGSVTVSYEGCLCDRDRELSLLTGIPNDLESCINMSVSLGTSVWLLITTLLLCYLKLKYICGTTDTYRVDKCSVLGTEKSRLLFHWSRMQQANNT